MSLAGLLERLQRREASAGHREIVAAEPPPPPPAAEADDDQGDDLDRWAWPHSTALTGAEIDTFTARLAQFTDRGRIMSDAERMADTLVIRDRDLDDRRMCLECAHLRPTWRCGNWQASGVSLNAWAAQLPAELVRGLHRCDGFKAQPQADPFAHHEIKHHNMASFE